MSGPSTLNVQLSTRPQFPWRIVDVIVAGIFIYAGAIKALDPVQFASDIDNYKIVPWPVSVVLAFYLPWLEIFCGFALVVRLLYRGALSILTALILVSPADQSRNSRRAARPLRFKSFVQAFVEQALRLPVLIWQPKRLPYNWRAESA